MIDPRPAAPEFDAYAGSYDEAVNRSLAFLGVKVDYFTRVKAGYLLDLLGRHFGKIDNLDVLDIGCGIGNYHPLLTGKVGSICGADVSPECLAQAASRNPAARYSHYDGLRLPYEDGRFDAVFTICVLHHVPPAQRPGFAAEMRRVLRPGGLAVVFEHNPLNPLTRRVVSNCPFDADALLLGQGETRRLLAGAGLGKAESRAILSIPSLGPASRKLDHLLGHLSLGAQYYAQAAA